jgi:hypothetical protein
MQHQRLQLQRYLASGAFGDRLQQVGRRRGAGAQPSRAPAARTARAQGPPERPGPAAAAAAAAAAQVRSAPHGRGILISAGGRKLTTHLAVTLRVLRRRLGCGLPVEVAWQGPREMDNATLAALDRDYGPVFGFDVGAVPYPAHHRRWGRARLAVLAAWQSPVMRARAGPPSCLLHVCCIRPQCARAPSTPSCGRRPCTRRARRGVKLQRWEGKVFALLHSRFREVLLLDSDSLPLRDPQALFRSPQYMRDGALFWPDIWRGWVGAGAYQLLGLNASRTQVGGGLAGGAIACLCVAAQPAAPPRRPRAAEPSAAALSRRQPQPAGCPARAHDPAAGGAGRGQGLVPARRRVRAAAGKPRPPPGRARVGLPGQQLQRQAVRQVWRHRAGGAGWGGAGRHVPGSLQRLGG